MVNLKFSFNQLKDLDNDLKASEKAIPVIVQKVMRLQLQPLRTELRALIPRTRGKLQRSFGFSIKRTQGKVTARVGFMTGKTVSASTAIAANVLQAGGAYPRKGQYLWIPVKANQNVDGSPVTSPRELIAAGGFIGTSRAGNRIAFLRFGDQSIPAFVLKTFVKLSRPPVPIDQRVEAALPELTSEIEETIKAVVEAKKAASGVL